MIEQTTTQCEDDRAFLLAFADDTEDAPWMVASDRHFLAVGASHFSLKLHGGEAHPEWYVSSEIFIYYSRPDGSVGKVAPDLFVALAPNHLRESFDARREGGFPPFVLEIVSPDSRQRDLMEKPRAYDLCGSTEYVIFDPYTTGPGHLTGYRRDARGKWGRWAAGPRGELRSKVLGLTLVVDELLLRFKDTNGNLLPIGEELQAALHLARRQWVLERDGRAAEALRAEEAWRRAEEAGRRAAEATHRADAAEARVKALEAELARRRGSEQP
ncbi:MAG TPA: Uma2 family endonuclease [Chloroflexota bacterium]|nr:Uma2 family endonuclease [Chloroflexota bacterium]